METLSTDLYEMARSLGAQLVSTLALLICLVVALARWKRHPKVSLVLAIAIILFIVHLLVFVFADIWLARWLIVPGHVTAESFFSIERWIATITVALIYGIFLLAVFMQRKNTISQPDNRPR
jgi:hypothetical protein